MTIHHILLAAVALTSLACSSAERAPGAAQAGSPDPLPFAAPTRTSCDQGEVRTCRVTLGERNGIVDCFEGVQACVDGAWGVCNGNPVSPTSAKTTCTVDTLDIAGTLMPSPATPTAFVRAWAAATVNQPALLVRLGDLKTATKITVGASDGRVPASFSPFVSAPPTFDLALGMNHAFALAERPADLKLRFSSAAAVTEIPVVSVAVEGKLTDACDGALSLRVTLTIPESAGDVTLGTDTLSSLLADDRRTAPETFRGFRLVLTTGGL